MHLLTRTHFFAAWCCCFIFIPLKNYLYKHRDTRTNIKHRNGIEKKKHDYSRTLMTNTHSIKTHSHTFHSWEEFRFRTKIEVKNRAPLLQWKFKEKKYLHFLNWRFFSIGCFGISTIRFELCKCMDGRKRMNVWAKVFRHINMKNKKK